MGNNQLGAGAITAILKPMKNKNQILKNVSKTLTGKALDTKLLQVAKANGGNEKDVPSLRNYFYKKLDNQERKEAYFATPAKKREGFTFSKAPEKTKKQIREKTQIKNAFLRKKEQLNRQLERDRKKAADKLARQKKREADKEAKRLQKLGLPVPPPEEKNKPTRKRENEKPRKKKAKGSFTKGTGQIKKELLRRTEAEGFKAEPYNPNGFTFPIVDIMSVYWDAADEFTTITQSPYWANVKEVLFANQPQPISRDNRGSIELLIREFINNLNKENAKLRNQNLPTNSLEIIVFTFAGDKMHVRLGSEMPEVQSEENFIQIFNQIFPNGKDIANTENNEPAAAEGEEEI